MKVALIGLPNVGKSTLFNRLTEKRSAIETPIPGTTRDRKRAFLQWNGVKIQLIDSPGIKSKMRKAEGKHEEDLLELEQKIQLQAEQALVEADVILYMIDFNAGAVAEDFEIIKKLRRVKNKPILMVANKADKPSDAYEAAQYLKLGLGNPLAVSAANGRGTRELLDAIASLNARAAKNKKAVPEISDIDTNHITLALIGMPNVGKSSLFNALIAQDAVVVSPVPHTTRDTNNTELTYKNYRITIVDTAGLRKKARIYKSDVIEIFSIKKTLEAIRKADIALLIIDINDTITTQDKKISKLIKDSGSGCVIVANKWDLVAQKTTRTLSKLRESIYGSFKSLDYAPVVFTDVKNARAGKIYGAEEKYILNSAETPDTNKIAETQPLLALLKMLIAIHSNRNAAFSPSQLKNLLIHSLKKQPPPKGEKGRRPFIHRIEQTGTNPPAFTLFLPTNHSLPDHYLGYIKNRMRERFKLWGTEIEIHVKN